MTFGLPLATEKNTGRRNFAGRYTETTEMDLLELIRAMSQRTRQSPARPWESCYSLYLKLVSRYEGPGYMLSRYVANPAERPDHLFQYDCGIRTFTQCDFETMQCEVLELTQDEADAWEGPACNCLECEVVTLCDGRGNLLLLEYCTAEGARRLMEAFEQAGNSTERGQR